MDADFGNHITLAAVAVWIIQKLKASESPYLNWIDGTTDNINRLIGALAASLSSVGIHMLPLMWDEATKTVTLQISGLDGYVLLGTLWGTVQTFIWQQLMYHGMIKHAEDTVKK